MPGMMKNIAKEKGTIHELFEHQLQDIFWAEQELGDFMPKLLEKISSKDLKNTLQEHIKITQRQVKRLENIFELIGSEKKAEECKGMVGLMSEAEEILEMADEGKVRDAFIIGAVQKMEHYEMASYGTLKALATLIGEYEVSTLLGETLSEEKEADMKLTAVAENFVNIEASREAGELEDTSEDIYGDEEEDFESSSTGSKAKRSKK
jgi:ferritin-like metal-binding protein YciE